MLKQLQIRDFAIVDRLELTLDRGMTVLTGETGAGKSILLDALGLTLGDRADSTAVTPGASRAEISAEFDVTALPAAAAWLVENELDDDGHCVLRRTVNADGGSRAYINGRPVPAQFLKALGEMLVDIHGQHAHQYLLRSDAQRDTLDAFGGLGPSADAVAAAYHTWRELNEAFAGLEQARLDREARLELLRYQVEELEALELSPEGVTVLQEEHQRLANMTRLQEGAHAAAAALSEADEGSAVDLLERAAAELGALTGYDAALASIAELAGAAAIQAKEAAGELRRYLADLDLDPEQLESVEQRLDTLQTLSRKHRCAPQELPSLLETLREELDELETAETRLGDLEARIGEARATWESAASRLSKARGASARRLAKAVTVNMAELGMTGGRFEATLQPLDGEPAAQGRERVVFEVTANLGQPLRPLAKVASGGELSRISLAIQVITAGMTGTPTLIFDEVDVGVGGGVAEIVGRKLRSLSVDAQVLCVTHQPQVAAQGHHHLRIRKATDRGQTRTAVTALEGEARIDEIARMLGGVAITAQTRSHAEEMIALARTTPCLDEES